MVIKENLIIILIRTELEGMYSSVKVNNVGFKGDRMSILYFKEIGEGADRKTYVYSAKVDNDQIENTSVMANACYYFRIGDVSFSPYIGIGLGLSRMKMLGMVSTVGPAYQLKADFVHHISKDVNMHVGYRHFSAFGKSYKLKVNLLGEVKLSTSGAKSILDDSIKEILLTGIEKQEDIDMDGGLFSTRGIEAGLTFHF
ncbi:P44/Msp2 family outer membrane protein [Wolbachia endosymbiont of Dipetalonema caudispina]|uniref:P44/Msp2 family outer membrane protein n=1 Tax=Wolbachia endosymbiont of Dipetalonema caudispina TaxID=1812112 RepID=UPI0021061ECE|nr:P44/Msp2 family outer membrane protein [Wolbachia endosymbiont of Dipetalonema caudispina]